MKKRTNNRQGLSSDARFWLDGNRNSGFYQFKPDEELQARWDRYGDHESMHWTRGMSRPQLIEHQI
ncbi:MAG: hypothetical protein ACXWJB_14495 [Limisphaerales bacterium]